MVMVLLFASTVADGGERVEARRLEVIDFVKKINFEICDRKRSGLAEIGLGHSLPEGPVMDCLFTPDVQTMGDFLGVHDAGHALVFSEADVPLAYGQQKAIAVAIVIHEPAVAQR